MNLQERHEHLVHRLRTQFFGTGLGLLAFGLLALSFAVFSKGGDQARFLAGGIGALFLLCSFLTASISFFLPASPVPASRKSSQEASGGSTTEENEGPPLDEVLEEEQEDDYQRFGS